MFRAVTPRFYCETTCIRSCNCVVLITFQAINITHFWFRRHNIKATFRKAIVTLEKPLGAYFLMLYNKPGKRCFVNNKVIYIITIYMFKVGLIYTNWKNISEVSGSLSLSKCSGKFLTQLVKSPAPGQNKYRCPISFGKVLGVYKPMMFWLWLPYYLSLRAWTIVCLISFPIQ